MLWISHSAPPILDALYIVHQYMLLEIVATQRSSALLDTIASLTLPSAKWRQSMQPIFQMYSPIPPVQKKTLKIRDGKQPT